MPKYLIWKGESTDGQHHWEVSATVEQLEEMHASLTKRIHQEKKPLRNRHCSCSRADDMHHRARPDCRLHGNTPEATAYWAGMLDGAAGFSIPDRKRRIVED